MTTQQLDSDLEALVRYSEDILSVLDESGVFQYKSPAIERVLGYEPGELVGESAFDYVHPDDRDEVRETFMEVVAGDDETTRTARFRFKHADGSWVWLEAVGSRSAADSIGGFVVNSRDVTANRRLQSELEASVSALHELYEIASDTDLTFDEKVGRVLRLGRTRLDLPYGFVTRTTESRQIILAAEGDHELLQAGESCPIEESYCRKTIDTDGLLAIDDAVAAGWESDPAYEKFGLGSYVGGKLVVDGDLFGTLCFASREARDADFTESERTFVELASRWLGYELEQRRYQQELERQNQRLDQFASAVSHDLRNPLNVVQGRLELAADRYGPDDDIDAAAEALERAFTRIEEMLEFARMSRSMEETEPVSIPDVAAEAWSLAGDDAGTLRVADDLETVEGDRSRLLRLFENLFRNAVEHGGSDVTVTVGPLPGRLGFYVADDGPGIPPENRDSVFEYGFTTRQGGSGFGLAIVKEIAAGHGWNVSVTDSDDGGARFEFVGADAT
ncbi:ATP-binding protein [Halobaculum sp. D14]|uniref:ATP-binding protein n=1 Tax=unclassified Halobaculum TaxID=2640896 RepID=UPI003EC0BA48